MLVIVAANAPHVHAAIRGAFSVLWFTSPYLVSSFALSFVYIFFLRPRAGIERISLPRYPDAADRSALFLVLAEIHKERRPTPIDQPRWLTIPRRALFTGIGIFGAVGSGKTTCCMYPFAEQLMAYRRDDEERRIGGLVLEVKGDFCYRVREILRKHGREDDYIELSLACPYRYNPLYNDLEAYALAYGIVSLLTNLSVVARTRSGRGSLIVTRHRAFEPGGCVPREHRRSADAGTRRGKITLRRFRQRAIGRGCRLRPADRKQEAEHAEDSQAEDPTSCVQDRAQPAEIDRVSTTKPPTYCRP